MNIIIMMATYNGEKFIGEQLKSIAEQTLSSNITLYVSDDNSTDSTLAIIENWKDKIQIIQRQNSIRQGAAQNFWNLLMSVPNADYYAFCDQDDIWEPDKLKCAMKAAEIYSSPILYHSNFKTIDENSNVINSNGLFGYSQNNIIDLMICPSGCTGCTMFFNLPAMQIFRKWKGQIPMHDYLAKIIMLIKGKVIYDQTPRISYRQHRNNVAARSNRGLYKNLKNTYNLWFRKGKYQTSNLANCLLENFENELNERDKEFLNNIVNSKNGFLYKIRILKMLPKKTFYKNALRSFKIRLLLGVL